MATYRMTAPEGADYEIEGPEGATDDQVKAEIIRQNPTLGQPAPAPKPPTPSLITAPFRRAAEGGRELAEAIYPAAPRPPESLGATAMRPLAAVGKILSSPLAPLGEGGERAWRYMANLTGDESDENVDRMIAHLESIPPAARVAMNWQADMDYQKRRRAMTQQERIESSAKAFGGALETTTGMALAPTSLPWWIGGGGKTVPQVGQVLKQADNLELPLKTILKGQEARPVPWQGAPGAAPEVVWNRQLVGPPPSPMGPGAQVAEEVLRQRSSINTAHKLAGQPSPVPPTPMPSQSLWQRPVTGLLPSDWAVTAAKWQAKANAFFTPQDIARGIPAAEQIVREGFVSADAAHLVTQDMGRKLQAIYKPLKGQQGAIEDVHRLLDGVPPKGPVTPEMVKVASDVRQVFDQLADMAGLPKQQRLADYFPHLREEVSSTLQLKIGKDGLPISKEIPQEFRVFFQKQRTLPSDETLDYSLNAVNAYLNAAAKRIAMKGGTLSDGRPVQGFLNRVADHLENLPDVPEIRSYFQQYINDLAHGRPGAKFQVLSPGAVATLKQVQFLRTIGANLMSPIQNLLQTMNTLALTDIRSWGAAWFDLVNKPEIVQLAKRTGLVDQTYSAADLARLSNPNQIQAAITSGANKSAILFKKAEETNRLHAFAAGYRDALRKGLQGDAAVDYAKDIVNRTQFRFGQENLPNWLRSPNAGPQLVGQYKQYQINQLNFLRNLAVREPKALAKWLTAGMLLGGQDIYGHAVGEQIRELMAAVLGGDPKDHKFRGILGEMGVYIGNQIGTGALPFEDMGGLSFMLPGPALGHLSSVISGVSGRDFSPRALTNGKWGSELSPDQRASHLTSSVNVQLNRLRQALVMSRAQGQNYRQADTMEQAMGLEDPTGMATVPKAPGEVSRKALGIPSMRAEEDFEKRKRVVEDIQEYKDLVSKKAAAIRRGDSDEVRRLNEEGVRLFGRAPRVTGETVRGQVKGTRTPILERVLRGAPKPIRQQERKEAEK